MLLLWLPTIGLADQSTVRLDGKVILKAPSNTKSPSSNGSWKAQGGGKYTLNVNEGGKNYEIQAFAEANKLVINREGYSMVFEK